MKATMYFVAVLAMFFSSFSKSGPPVTESRVEPALHAKINTIFTEPTMMGCVILLHF